MQAKLHRWAGDDSSRRFGDLFSLVCNRASRPGPWGVSARSQSEPARCWHSRKSSGHYRERRKRWHVGSADQAELGGAHLQRGHERRYVRADQDGAVSEHRAVWCMTRVGDCSRSTARLTLAGSIHDTLMRPGPTGAASSERDSTTSRSLLVSHGTIRTRRRTDVLSRESNDRHLNTITVEVWLASLQTASGDVAKPCTQISERD
jgi:hypothetical protein